MIQFLVDQIDQLDLALDQLAVRDRNFDRFAIMLVDNVVELVLHQYAQDRSYESESWRQLNPEKYDQKLLTAALGQHFDAKVKFASSTGLVTSDLAESLRLLHGFRNSAHHRGLRHEGILHSLAILYFVSCCALLKEYSPRYFSWSSDLKVPHRAIKYVGQIGVGSFSKPSGVLGQAWARLEEVAKSMDGTLVADLAQDMLNTIEMADNSIDFLATNNPSGILSRDQVVVETQTWYVAGSEEGLRYAKEHGYDGDQNRDLIAWVMNNYPLQARRDPIPLWLERQKSLAGEKDAHVALRKYCSFMSQTQDLRRQVEENAFHLDGYIQLQIDIARGK